MCAINGFNFLDRELIAKMNLCSRHRGPDAAGIFTEDGISLGHNRLSIIDLSERASQPMKSFDDAEVIVFNGEIYNFKELKNELSGSYPFKSESDTELILASYRKWGKECVKKFNGIFAFALWDRSRREIFLARDHAGIKPLYYYFKDGKFIFSSEIKSILEHGIDRKLNLEAFNHYFRVLYVPEPLTMFEDMYKFPQASRGIYRDGKLTIEKYWKTEPGNYLAMSENHLEDELRNRIQRAVKCQLISDRPLGLYLSGGMDSSVILREVSEFRKKIDTFSVGFVLKEKEQSEKFNADFELARKTASFFGTSHNEVLVNPDEVLGLLEKSVWHMDEPISNPTSVAMLKLSGFSKKKADVVLTGEGGDELFGGYERYRLSLCASLFQKVPAFLRSPFNLNSRLKKLNAPSGVDRFSLFMFQKDGILSRVLNPDFLDPDSSRRFFEGKYLNKANSGADAEEILMNTDRQTWLVDFALMLTDKMSMANGLEARVPFLDKDLIEFSARISRRHKVGLFGTKKVLKSAYRGLIPDYLLNQPKRGWFSPGAKWLRYPEIYEACSVVLRHDYHAQTAGVFNWPELDMILKKHISGEEYNLNIIWAVLTFQLWARKFNIHI